MKTWIFCALALAGLGTQTAADLARTIEIPATRSGGMFIRSARTDAGVTVRDVEYRTSAGRPIYEAYIVAPEERPAACAAILFVHWFAPPDPTSNHTQFLDEAKEWARRGVVSLLPAAFWGNPDRYKARTWQTDFDNSVEQARALRYAFQNLRSERCVDPSRVAIVGHDYGAMFGSLVAATEPVKAVVLIAGVPRFSSWYEFGSSTGVPRGDELTKYRAELARIDPGSAVSLINAPVLFQFGTKDKYTPKESIDAFVAAAKEPKALRTYDSGHDMKLPEIRRDRTEWLATQLGVK